MKHLFEQIAAMQDIMLASATRGPSVCKVCDSDEQHYRGCMGPCVRADEPAPAMIPCSFCGGSGESHSAYRDSTCKACNGEGLRPENWREMLEDGDED